MSKCPKCKTDNPVGATECDSCGVVFAHIRGAVTTVNPECPWNDHGLRCNKIGSIKSGLSWYCPEHYWRLTGIREKTSTAAPMSYRERWYAERGLPYEPPKLEDVGPFKCVAKTAADLAKRLEVGELGPRQREVGEDESYVLDEVPL